MLKNDPDREWEWYGAREPCRGVLTEQRFMCAGLDDSARAEHGVQLVFRKRRWPTLEPVSPSRPSVPE
jgi:hypothetical protein